MLRTDIKTMLGTDMKRICWHQNVLENRHCEGKPTLHTARVRGGEGRNVDFSTDVMSVSGCNPMSVPGCDPMSVSGCNLMSVSHMQSIEVI